MTPLASTIHANIPGGLTGFELLDRLVTGTPFDGAFVVSQKLDRFRRGIGAKSSPG